jgi:PAS domain S-box-containing protein
LSIKILVVDDEPVIRELLEDFLGMQGYEVRTCGTAAAALDLFAAEAVDLVLLDIGLPDMNGFKTMSAMHQQSPETLVVMFTGDATVESAVEAIKSGAYDYLRKPIQIEELNKTVKNAVDHRRLDLARKKSEAALQESEERFRALVEYSFVGICIAQNNRIVYQNPEQEKLFGTLPQQPLNQLFRFVHPEDVDEVIEGYRSLLTGKQTAVEHDFRFYPSRRRGKDSALKWVQARASVFQYQGQEAILINMMDITRAKEMEQILRLKSKMISLGRVAAGIAHEIRNPLTGINSYLFTLEDLLDSEDINPHDMQMMRQIVEQMQTASNKIESVIKRVLDFSRPGAPSMALISMNDPMEEALKLSAVSLRKKEIQIETELDPNLPRCYGDTHLIEQVILNLIDNAVKAMQKHDGEKRLRLASYSRNNSIFLIVSDTGPGISKAVREKIFEPFYTTDSDGSGIGLAISQRIVNDHNGTIRVDGNRWGGAEFIIELPIEKRMRG